MYCMEYKYIKYMQLTPFLINLFLIITINHRKAQKNALVSFMTEVTMLQF